MEQEKIYSIKKTLFLSLLTALVFYGCQKEPEPITKDPFTITSNGSTIVAIARVGSPYFITLEYRKGEGSWSAYIIGSEINLSDGECIQFIAGERGNENFSRINDNGNYYNVIITGTGTVNASGNIMSLLGRSGKRSIMPESGFYMFFSNCNKLIDARKLKLPATSLAENCYCGMFSGCTSLTQAPELPATSLAERCYGGMFYGCTSLTQAPKLPATSLAEICYINMFSGCTSLIQAPELPATSLAGYCYGGMFYGCTSLTQVPELPATSLAIGCYSRMFYGCTSLIQASELPATSLILSCYSRMFYGCTSLTQAPELPATTLPDRCHCYDDMFYGCTKLNFVKALFTTTPQNEQIGYWLLGVSPTGTFVKSKNATWDRNHVGIPRSWTVVTE